MYKIYSYTKQGGFKEIDSFLDGELDWEEALTEAGYSAYKPVIMLGDAETDPYCLEVYGRVKKDDRTNPCKYPWLVWMSLDEFVFTVAVGNINVFFQVINQMSDLIEKFVRVNSMTRGIGILEDLWKSSNLIEEAAGER